MERGTADGRKIIRWDDLPPAERVEGIVTEVGAAAAGLTRRLAG